MGIQLDQLLKLNTLIWACFLQSPWLLPGLPSHLRTLFSHTRGSTTTPPTDSNVYTGHSFGEGICLHHCPCYFVFSPSSLGCLHLCQLLCPRVTSGSTLKIWTGLVSYCPNKPLLVSAGTEKQLPLLLFPSDQAFLSSPAKSLFFQWGFHNTLNSHIHLQSSIQIISWKGDYPTIWHLNFISCNCSSLDSYEKCPFLGKAFGTDANIFVTPKSYASVLSLPASCHPVP